MKKVYSRLSKTAVLLVFLGLSITAFAQDRNVSGTVKDETGNPMPGVNVIIKGTTSGTATDGDGKYTLSVPSNAILVFTFVGYATAEVPVGSQTTVDVQMNPDATSLSEIVVTGYASQEKKDLTGSVATVKTSELTQLPSSNITNQLQGRVAGVTVSQNSQPGAVGKVRIRGLGSFQNNDPLYIVDGVPTTDISTINPGDIESLSVLKDAGAASIYGSRASNGVILVTTKKGASGGVKVNYNMYIGSQNPGKSPDFLLNAQEYANLQWLVYKNDGTSETHPVYGPSSNPTPTLPSWAGNTDWYKQITRNAKIQNHEVTLSGGNQNSKFYGGLNYYDQDGIVITNFSKRFTARFNSEFNIKDRVTIGENFTVTGRTGNGVDGNGSENSPIMRVFSSQPIIPAVVNQNITGISHSFVPGEYGGTGIAPRLGNGSNAYADLQRNKDNRSQDVRIVGSAYMNIKIFDYLSFKTTFGGTVQNGYISRWNSSTYERSENISTPSYYEEAYYNKDWVWTNALTFNKTFGSHKVLAVAGYEALSYGIGRDIQGQKAGYFSDKLSFRTLTTGAQTFSLYSYYNTPTTLASSFARVDYSFGDKYLVSATVRRDGSSRFSPSNKYGTFPSVSAGWRVSEENFMSGVSFISNLKIRGGYGTMGNQLAVSPLNQYYLYSASPDATFYDINGSGTGSAQGFRPSQIGNINAKWESNTTTNAGIDAGFLDNRLVLNVDWYTKKTKDLLFQVPLPAIYGAADPPYVNIASMTNTGIDVALNFKQRFSSDLALDITGTITHYKNTITKVSDGADYFVSTDYSTRIGPFNRNAVDHSMSSFYGYQVTGLFQSAAEVSGAATQDGAEPGFFRYADLNDDGVIDDKDRTFLGNPNPKFTYGLNIGVTYKQFDLSTFLYGSYGNDIFNYTKWWLDFWPSFQNQKSTRLLYDSWTPEHTNTSVPKASNKSNFSNNTVSNSYYVEKGSFLRMQNLQVGYNVPAATLSKIGLTSARIYLQGVNLFTITKYSGVNPDVNQNDDRSTGVDQGPYPIIKTYTLGLNLSF